jgi:hypothetical protein
MTSVRRLSFAVILLAAAFGAQAGEATLEWTPPNKNCDGTPIGAISHYEVRWGQNMTQLPELPPFTWMVTGLTPGAWWFNIAVVNAEGERSDFISVEKTVLDSEFTAALPDVYSLVKRVDRVVLTRVGTVPVGTPCLADQTVNGKYVVPRSKVTWAGLVRPDVVVAACQ